MRCSNCNTENAEDARFCRDCGAPLYVQGSADTSGKKEKKKKPKKKLITAICIIVIAALIAGCAGWFGFSYINDKDNEGSIYTVTFDINADEEEVSYAPNSQNVEYGLLASCPAYPVRDGYIFGGWYTDSSCKKEYDFTKAVKKNITLYACWLDPDSEEAQITDEECEDYFDCLDELSEVYESFCTDEGDIEDEDIPDIIEAAQVLAQKYKEEGKVTYYSAGDRYVYLEFSSLLTYVFMVSQEDTSGDPTMLSACVLYPFYSTDWAWKGDVSSIAENEDAITSLISSFSETSSFYDEEISWADGLLYLEDCQVVIWDGHGGYVSDLGSILATSETVSIWSALADDLDLYVGEVYQDLNHAMGTKAVTISGVRSKYVYCLTPEYFSACLPDLDDAIVYLSACESGYDSRLADAFIEHGAKVVVANAGTEPIYTGYTQYMVGSVFALMLTKKSENEPYYTVQEALSELFSQGYDKSFAVKENGTIVYTDSWPQLFYAAGDVDDAANYTLWAGLEGVVTSDAELNMEKISVSVVNNTTGQEAASAEPDEDGYFVIDMLDGGDDNSYTLYVYYDGTEVYALENFFIETHRYKDFGDIYIDGTEVDIYVTDEDGEDISEALVSLTDEDGNVYSASLGTDDSLNYVYKTSVMPGEYTIEISCDGYRSVTDSVSVGDDALTLSYILETYSRVCITQLPIIDYDQYDENEGDSCIFHFDGSGLVNVHGDTVRNGSTSVDGTVYSNGLEVWIARWNFTQEMSWASITYALGGDYSILTGGTGLIESYNTTDFDTTIYFYDGNTLLASYHMTPSSYSYDISIDVTGVEELTIYVSDNEYAKGGTSFALYDMFLE